MAALGRQLEALQAGNRPADPLVSQIQERLANGLKQCMDEPAEAHASGSMCVATVHTRAFTAQFLCRPNS